MVLIRHRWDRLHYIPCGSLSLLKTRNRLGMLWGSSLLRGTATIHSRSRRDSRHCGWMNKFAFITIGAIFASLRVVTQLRLGFFHLLFQVLDLGHRVCSFGLLIGGFCRGLLLKGNQFLHQFHCARRDMVRVLALCPLTLVKKKIFANVLIRAGRCSLLRCRRNLRHWVLTQVDNHFPFPFLQDNLLSLVVGSDCLESSVYLGTKLTGFER